MAKRQRRPIDKGDFKDLLKNYDSIDVDDFELARSR